MNSMFFMLINAAVLILAAGGSLMLIMAAWKSAKALESIAVTLSKIYEKKER